MHPKQTRVASKEAVNHAARTNDRRWLNFTPAFADSMIDKHASNTTVNRQNREIFFLPTGRLLHIVQTRYST
jgi:hypothetical protein